MPFLSFVLCACGFSLAITMSAPGGSEKNDDMKRIQGTWVVDPATYAEVKDKEVLEEIKAIRFIFEGDTCTMKHPPGNTEKFRFHLDPAKQPRQIDMSDGVKGIYELDGETLKLCWDQQAKTNGRPTKFSLRQEKASVHYFVLKRESPQKDGPKKKADTSAEQESIIAAIKLRGGHVLIDRGTNSTSTIKVILSETGVKDKDLEQLKGLPTLQELYLFRTKVTGEGLKHLKGLTQLQRLDLSHCTELTEAGLANLKGLTKLQTLDVTATGMRDADLKYIKNLTDLQALYLRFNPKITDAGLEELKGLTKLQTLVLDRTEITDGGLKHLKGLTKLRTLHLACQLTDATLGQLKGFTDLQSLSLWGTQATDKGLVNLKGLTNLEELYLVGTQVTDAGLDNLKGLSKLRTLDLRGTKTTDRGVKSLKRSLPEVKVIR